MTVSDWGEWLPRAIESATPAGVAIWYLGCNGFALKGSGGTTLFVDPYLGTGDPPRTTRMIPVPFSPADVGTADALLATHEHSDHVHGPSQAPILETTGADFYAPDDSLSVALNEEEWVEDYDLAGERFDEVSEGETIEIGEFTVHVEAAYDPDATHPVSYVVEHDAGTFFHAGDARASEAFEEVGEAYDLDLGAIAFGTVGRLEDDGAGQRERTRWYNDENEVIEAANELRVGRLVPTHWDMWKGLTADPTVLHRHAASFPYPRALEVREIGDRIDLAAGLDRS
jgi:L-ascorbate 6-phosphate lactonase